MFKELSTLKSIKSINKQQRTRPEHPLLFSNKITTGELQKIYKGFSERSTARLVVLGGVVKLFGFCLKAGLNLGVKSQKAMISMRKNSYALKFSGRTCKYDKKKSS